MTERKKRNIIIIILCTCIFFMGVGYAILTSEVVTTGTGEVVGQWDIVISSITPTTEYGTGKSVNAVINNNKLGATFSADLYAITDYVEYTVVINNNGNIDAKLSDIVITVSNESEFVKFSTNLNSGGTLNAGATTTFTARIYAENTLGSTLVDALGVEYNMNLIYTQLSS